MQTKQMRSGREEVNVWIPKLTKQTCGIAGQVSTAASLVFNNKPCHIHLLGNAWAAWAQCGGLLPAFQSGIPSYKCGPCHPEHFASVCVFALLWKQQRCHLPHWGGGVNAGAWVQLLWEHLALAGCAGRGRMPSQAHLLLWRLNGASWGQEGRGEALGAPLPWIITLGTSNNLAVTSVVLSKKLAWFILEATVFMVCMSVKSACLSWGSRNPSAYQYHCIHSPLTRTDSNVKDSDGSEKCPCFILTLCACGYVSRLLTVHRGKHAFNSSVSAAVNLISLR